MKKLILLAMVLSGFVAGNANAQPPGWCDVYGGWDPEVSPSWWYLLDYYGYVLENGDWVYVAWTGPDGEIDPPDESGNLTDDDSLCNYDSASGDIEYGMIFIVVTTYPPGGGRPEAGDLIYCRMFDGPEGSIGPGNYYGDSQLYEVEYIAPPPGEEFLCMFPGDPGGGHTDTAMPSGEVAVELMSFEAIGRDGQVLLEWKTASERNNFGFHIERDGERITKEIIPASGNSETENRYTCVDRNLTNGTTYYYNLIAVDMAGLEEVANESPVAATPSAHVPTDFALGQNYPNPFNPTTEITYAIPRDVHVILKVYNILGAEVATLVDGNQAANYYTMRWDAGELASGVYFCRLQAGAFSKTIKTMLLK
jgi:hypothetical protein